MRNPRLVSWCMAFGLCFSFIPAVSAASKSQVIQVTVIIPERSDRPTQDPSPGTWVPPLGSVATLLRDANHPTPTLLYTYTEPN